ncbi:L-alanyl-gamma-D-glutamyl-L-diamino acid endopeptidase [Bacteroides pyogenes DSM 20611 = JCM 6294]|uniref:L-alanyl-gamma-D-glutamyl-L-diamino acid endopeptidase n=1 Tax=Bacteroides pyogenes DSM 20611 = JCM 6294 TaxID=1121100 RepID=W4PFG2_9BACE|nr:L-alanyl-gamma-D-glutamyl-L-diamino acid endopeptidase [Bacteroides pyogenes DSM 20611 = JCM 6294]
MHVNSFNPEDSDYDESNTERLLFAVRFLPYINKEKEINTTLTNSYYTDFTIDSDAK